MDATSSHSSPHPARLGTPPFAIPHNRAGLLFFWELATMTREQQIKHDIRHLTRKVWRAMCLSVLLILGWGALTLAIHMHGKESQHAGPAR